ncbi:S8 family serine peptidase [Wenzhouxiangella sp. EGI_FJ10305]|uniref:S8 family serine peptidase n=1 Tax=Wenzhouxiangella sp. EGI_FJ10305 TaxID=3243768 RepID=UPI0035D859BE
MLGCKSLLRLSGVLVLAVTFLSTTHAADLRTAKDPIPGQYIVVLEDGVATLGNSNGQGQGLTVAAAARAMARDYGAQLKGSFSHVLPGFVIEADEDTLVNLLEDDRVAYVEEDGITHVAASQSNATWGLDRVDQRDLPLDSEYTYNTTASGVHAYIVDTGVLSSHSEFSGRMGQGYSAINDGNGSDDCNGHGTHVAGTVAGSTYGVAKGATVHGVRVLDCEGSGTNSGVIEGMDWVAANAQFPAVANMSLGGGASSSIDDAVTNMRDAGVTVVVAAGNESQDACNSSPARSADAITVGSTTDADSRSSFSNYGDCVDIFAPGSDITSAWYTNDTATNTISGTSMASPHVAGIAALYLADNSGATPTQVENAIYDSGTSGRLSSIGSGSPNLLAYSLFDGSDGGDDDDGGDDGGDGGTTELTNGESVDDLSGSQDSETFFTIDVPSDASNLAIDMSGGSGDADLYVKFGSEPTSSDYDCRPYEAGNDETCTFDDPEAGTYHIMIHGYDSYSGVSLVASFDEDDGGDDGDDGGDGSELTNGEPVDDLSGAQDSETFFTIDVPSDASNLAVDMSGGSGDADLYVKFGSEPTRSDYDCRPYEAGNEESCTFDDPEAGMYHIMIHGYDSYSGVSLVASYDEDDGGDGGDGGAPCTDCDQYSGSLGDGDSEVQPDGDYYYAGSGTHNGWLVGPTDADFDLELYRWDGSDWSRVANSASADSEESISYDGSAGYYYWKVLSYSGSGSYDLWLDTP